MTARLRPFLSLLVFAALPSACSCDCIDGQARLPISAASPALSVGVFGAAPDGLWWVPSKFGEGTLQSSSGEQPVEVAFQTPTLAAIRVPATLAAAEQAELVALDGERKTVAVVTGQGEPRSLPANSLVLNVVAEELPVGPVGYCPSGPFDTPPPTSFVPGLRIELAATSEEFSSLAIDIFDDGATDEDSPRVADTAGVRSGFDQGFLQGDLQNDDGDTAIVFTIAPGTYRVRARALFDGTTGEAIEVEVPAAR